MPLFNYSQGQDIGQALGQVGPAVAGGQYRGMQLGEQRQRDQGRFAIEQQNQQRMLMELQQRIAQAQAENQFRQQQLALQQAAGQETAKYHEGMLGVQSNRLQNAQNKKQADKWLVTPQGFLLNQATGETKPLPQGLGQAGGQGKTGVLNPTGILNSYVPAIDAGIHNPNLINPNPTNTLYNPGIASMYSAGTNLQSQLMQRVLGSGQGQPPGTNGPFPPQATNNVPQQPRFRFDPASGQLIPQ